MSLLAIHFLLVATYCLSPSGSKLSFLSTAYCYPLFHQSWALFVPPPKSNYHLFITDTKGRAHDIFGDLIEEHRRNRLAGNTPVLVSFVNSIHQFEKNTTLLKTINGPVKNDLNFELLQHSVLNYCAAKNISLKNEQFLLLVAENNRTRFYFN